MAKSGCEGSVSAVTGGHCRSPVGTINTMHLLEPRPVTTWVWCRWRKTPAQAHK